MLFRKVDSQYHSCTKEAQSLIKLAGRYNLDTSSLSSSSSAYFTIYGYSEDHDPADVRVSRHEPNYSMRGDKDIMVYIGYGRTWIDIAESFCRQVEKWFEIEKTKKVESYFKSLRTREANKQKEKEERRKRQETETAQRILDHHKATLETLERRCKAMGITKQVVKEALIDKVNPDDPCCLHTQIRKWASHLDYNEVLERAL